jgi:hypothetical protein
MKKIIVGTLMLAIAFTACKKSDVIDTTAPNPNTPIPTPTQTVKDIYVGGYEYTSFTPSQGGSPGYYSNPQAKIWKNGIQMPINPTPFLGSVNDIAVVGNDVYAVGQIDTADYQPNNQVMVKPAFWKNGVPTFLSLPGQGGVANKIQIVGADIYIAGSEYGSSSTGTGVIWKNGIKIYSEANTSIRDLKVIGNDIYMALRQGAGSGATGAYYKNGVYTGIGVDAYPAAIAIDGANIYTAGLRFINGKPIATMWKNTTETELFTSTLSSSAQAITVNNGNVYVVGYRNAATNAASGLYDRACVWKNGVEDFTYGGYNPILPFGATMFNGVEFVNNEMYTVGWSTNTSTFAAGNGLTQRVSFTQKNKIGTTAVNTNMSVTPGNNYGVTPRCMFITKQ